MSINTLEDINILVATFYRSGILALRQLFNMGYTTDNIRVLTYDRDRNQEVIQFLDQNDVSFSTADIERSETKTWIEKFGPDVIFSLYYRDKIPVDVLEMPPRGAVNVHPSLLPKHSGVLSVPWAMVEDGNKTGFTYHYMNEEFDEGSILLQEEVEIMPSDTAYSLYHRLIHASAARFHEVFDLVIKEGADGQPQTGERSYHGRGELPNDGVIDPTWDDERIDRFIRAMYYPPFRPAVLELDGKEHEVVTMDDYRTLIERK